MRWSWVGLLAVVVACAEAPRPVVKRWPLEEVPVLVRVTDTANQPIPGVSLLARRAERGSTVTRSGTTDAIGTARLQVMPGWYVLQVDAPGFVSVTRTDARVPFGDEARWDVTLERAVPFAGRVVDAEGRPVAGALLRLSRSHEDLFGLATESDAEGRFHIDGVPAGAVTLRAEKDGWSPTRLELVAPAPELKVVMGRLGSLRVRVLDPQGRALPGEATHLYAMDKERFVELFPEKGPEDVVFQQLPSGRYVVTGRYKPSPECWWERSIEVQVTPATRTEATVRFEDIHALGPWRARAVDAAGQGLAERDGTVWTGKTPTDEAGQRGSCDFRTARDGSFSLPHLLEAPENISLAEPDNRREWMSQGAPPPGTGEALMFRLVSGALKGRVVRPDGQPVGYFKVNGQPPHNPRGEYVQYVGMNHTHQWVIDVLGFAPALVRAQGRDGEVVQVPDVVLDEGRTVQGRVFARDGRTGVPNQAVDLVETFDLEGNGERRPGGTMTDAEGRFRLEHVAGRSQVLRVDAKELGTVLHVLEPDETAVRLRLVPNAQVQGSVTDGARVPLAGVKVDVRCEGGFNVRTRTDGAGSYAVNIPGDRECFVHPEGRHPDVRRLDQPPLVSFSPMRLRMKSGSRQSVDLESRKGPASLEVSIEASLEFVTAFLLAGDVSWPPSPEALDALIRAGFRPDTRPEVWDPEEVQESYIPPELVGADFRFSHLPLGHYTLFIRDQMGGTDALLRMPVELTRAGVHSLQSVRPANGDGRLYMR